MLEIVPSSIQLFGYGRLDALHISLDIYLFIGKKL